MRTDLNSSQKPGIRLGGSFRRGPPSRLNFAVADTRARTHETSSMWHLAHIDGCTLVIIRSRKALLSGYEVIESGMMQFDGEVLRLVSDQHSRGMAKAEVALLQPVTPQTKIVACIGFDFFMLRLACT